MTGCYAVGSMFAGIGGICLGFKEAGADIVWANEIDHSACETYRLNFDSPDYFSAKFKTKTGRKPSDLRNAD